MIWECRLKTKAEESLQTWLGLDEETHGGNCIKTSSSKSPIEKGVVDI